jgi:hypothetical protein
MMMSTKPKKNGSKNLQATSTPAEETGDASVWNAVRLEDIRRRAYEIYLERGQQPDTELGDWLQAEREIEQGVL